MHRLTLLSCLLILPLLLRAQLITGDRLLSMQTTNQAGIDYRIGEGHVEAGSYIDYGWLLSNRILVGGQFNLSVFRTDEYGYFGSFRPYFRYYAINRDKFMLFGEASILVEFQKGEATYADDFGLAIGGHYPLAAGIFLTPKLQYSSGRRNPFGLSLGLELVLGKNNRPEENPLPSFSRGTIMMGGSSLGSTVTEDRYSFGLLFGSHYFLSRRFAPGVQVGFNYLRWSSEVSGTGLGEISFRSTGISAGLSPRYYLTVDRRFVWFVQAGVTYRLNRFRDGSLDDAITNTGWTHSGGGGVQWFVRQNVALELAADLIRLSNDFDDFTRLRLGFGIRSLF